MPNEVKICTTDRQTDILLREGGGGSFITLLEIYIQNLGSFGAMYRHDLDFKITEYLQDKSSGAWVLKALGSNPSHGIFIRI